jgi:hypothetical protein
MSLINKIIIDKMIENINNNNNIKTGVCAVMMYGTKPIGNICSNVARNYYNGMICPSMHAEVNAIKSFFGKDISYSEKYGWKKSRVKERQKFEYHGD